eukprot:TRINITY_DN2494_c0_g1_i1.p1 TRINITY_DN2494_c0_g1~~TRINITY_DN2494_c0_g1_i1.p1  ORF type:complete len:125 (-),score=11.48 TRINITY_DN2494_c0_g1_i1:56-430(-)
MCIDLWTCTNLQGEGQEQLCSFKLLPGYASVEHALFVMRFGDLSFSSWRQYLDSRDSVVLFKQANQWVNMTDILLLLQLPVDILLESVSSCVACPLKTRKMVVPWISSPVHARLDRKSEVDSPC